MTAYSKNIKCPYCGAIQAISINSETRNFIETCDIDNNGCDKDFAVFGSVTVNVRVSGIENQREEQ